MLFGHLPHRVKQTIFMPKKLKSMYSAKKKKQEALNKFYLVGEAWSLNLFTACLFRQSSQLNNSRNVLMREITV